MTTENGGDVQTNFIEELYDKFLECRLCSRTYRHPKMLVCQHTFCADCLETHYEMDEQDRPYRFLLSHNRDLSCPCCRARTPLPSGGIWRLPDNFLVANLTDIIRRRGPAVASKSGGGGVCEICRPVSIVLDEDGDGGERIDESRQPAATVKCIDCGKLLCADCAELHRETKVTASHALFTISDDHDVECKIHRSETLRFYCEPCEQCVCVLCALHEHKEHDVSTLADGLDRHRGTFDALLDDCKTRIDVVRQQLILVDAFKSSMNAAEEKIRHAAIDAIAAVRGRERELLEALRSFIGDDTVRFVDDRDDLDLRLTELSNVRDATEAMIGRSSVELLMSKKEVHDRLRTALNRQQIQTPDRVRLGQIHYVAGAEPFRDLHRQTSDVAKLFRSVNEDARNSSAVENHVSDASSSSSSATSSGSETDSDDSSSDDEQRQLETVCVVSKPSPTEHITLVQAPSHDESATEEGSDDENDDDNGDDYAETSAPVTKICISDGVVRRMVIRSQSLSDAAGETAPPPRRSGRKIPDFSRPKPVVEHVERGTQMEQVETTDSGTEMPRIVVYDKETYTGYVYLVHKNVSTDNQGTADKGTSTSVDVAAAYRNASNTVGRSTTITRGTNTLRAATSDRASSPVASLRVPVTQTNPPATVAKVPAYPTSQRPGVAQVPSNTRRPSTADSVIVAAPQSPPAASKIDANAQKVLGAQPAPQTTPAAAAAPRFQTASTTTTPTTLPRQATSGISPPTPTGPPVCKPLPTPTPKQMTPSTASLPSATAMTPSQTVTSPSMTSSPQPTSSLAASVPSGQKVLPPPSALSPTASAPAMAASPAMTRINPTTVTAMAGASTAPTISPTAPQKPVTSSNHVLRKETPSLSTQSVTNASIQPAPSANVSKSVNDNRMQSVSTKAAVVTPPAAGLPANIRTTTPATSSVGVPTAVAAVAAASPLPASAQKAMTSEQAAWLLRQPQPGVQSLAMTSSSHITVSQATTSTTLTRAVPQNTAQPVYAPTATTATAPTTQKLTTSSFSSTTPVNVTSTTTSQAQLQTTSINKPSSNTVANSIVVTTEQKPVTSPTTTQKPVTSSVSSTKLVQSPTALTTATATTPQSTSQFTTSNSSISNSVVSMQLVSTSGAPCSTPVSAMTTTQKPVTSPALPTIQFQRATVVTTTAQNSTPASINVVSNTAAFIPQVPTSSQNSVTATAPCPTQMSTTTQKLVTSEKAQLTSSSSSPSATAAAAASVASASVDNSAAATTPQQSVATRQAMTLDSVAQGTQMTFAPPPPPSSSPIPISNSPRPRSVFRSFSMDNLRAPTPVLRPPPPIMTTSVAAVTQRLNNEAANGKNGQRSNR